MLGVSSFKKHMNEGAVSEEVVLCRNFVFGEGEKSKVLLGRLLEYTIGSSNIAEVAGELGREWSPVSFVEPSPPLACLTVAECSPVYI
jgi:hypothetical protein